MLNNILLAACAFLIYHSASVPELSGSVNSCETEKSDQESWKLSIPSTPDGQPLKVFVSLYFASILEVDSQTGEIHLDMDMCVRWEDEAVSEQMVKERRRKVQFSRFITLEPEFLTKIWKPRIFIDEMSKSRGDSLFDDLNSAKYIFNEARGGGDISLCSRANLVVRCEMEFALYPSDSQVCSFIVRTYSYTVEELLLRWEPVHPVYMERISDSNFYAKADSPSVDQGVKTGYIEETFNENRRGNYSALSFSKTLTRKISGHIIKTYLPSACIVSVVWFGFLYKAEMVESRITLGSGALLTLTATFASTRESAPKVSYITALDIWILACVVYIIAGLGLFILRFRSTRRQAQMEEFHAVENNADEPEVDQAREENGNDIEQRGANPAVNRRATMMQIFASFSEKQIFRGYVLAFFVFGFTYWGVLLYVSGYYSWNPSPVYNNLNDKKDSFNLYSFHEI